jgi:fructosamine-3-kinase
MDIEAKALGDIKAIGVPVPHVFAVDASRSKYPFSYQLLEFVNFKDLNTLYKTREFAIDDLAHDIGHYIALWQEIKPLRFGLFDPVYLYNEKRLKGFHNSYPQYFLMNFDNHLDFLLQSNFLEKKLVDEIYALVEEHKALLDLKHGVMVHKDLAFWNILGTQSKIHSFIDWDDVISGDPTDDISLLACFHKGSFIREVIRGYKSVRPLPIDFELRFWLHLLRNMIVKAVIRVGGGYFEREDDLFLIGKGQSGEMLKIFTRERITMACLGLKNKVKIADL